MVVTESANELLSRGGVYAALSRVFVYPNESVGQKLARGEFHRHIKRMLAGVPGSEELRTEVRQSAAQMRQDGGAWDPEHEYQQMFEGGQALRCPLGETEYTASHVWMQTQQMADIAGFYQAFGVDARESGERPDALSVELEFMYLLCVKEAAALDAGDAESAAICREARGRFIKAHLGAWLPKLTERVEQFGGTGLYAVATGLALGFVKLDAAALGSKEE